MGIYVNPGNENLKIALNSQIFVDKSLVLKKLCSFLNSNQRFICVSRPRRFGKSTVRDIMVAYFSKGCDSREMFSNLKIAKDPCFGENLNKFNLLSIDMGFFYNNSEDKNEVLENLRKELLEDFRKEFPAIEFKEDDSIAKMILRVYDETNTQFVIIIDEYDTLIREKMSDEMVERYRSLLNALFKSEQLSKTIALAYITGILPVIKDKVQSKLNNFTVQSTMLMPWGMEEYFGFTKEETEALCNEYGMSFAECENWYDGYKIGGINIYNPNSVVIAMMTHEYGNYWMTSGSYDAVSDYIKLDYDGVKSAVTEMLSGREAAVNAAKFNNSLNEINTKDDVLTYLIHLGYLNYNKETGCCRIPNKEIRQEWENAVESTDNFSKVAQMIKESEKLLYLTQNGASEEVAAALDKAHTEVSSVLNYNFESSLQAAIMLAFYTARTKYTIIQELPAGYGFADIGFIPKNPKDPAMIIELKCNQDADTAIKQIKNKNYPAAFENYLDNLLLVGVNYDKTTKVHKCVIEKYQR
ncbi:AAA family ATPase [bacterium]|nr:AAA family ATPase [bacterium]